MDKLSVSHEMNSECEDLNLDFPPDVLKALQEILPSDDPFDSSNFNAVEYINNMFPTEQSLHHIDDVLGQMKMKITEIDDDIRSVVRSLTDVEQDGRASLISAQEAIAELFSRFGDIKDRASDSENRVKEITRDIKQLDIAKKNLTTSITTLNHLQMLVEGVDKLSTLKIKREYGEIATLLQGVNNVLDHLARYKHIPQVADLSGQVDQIQKDLEKQILDDFNTALHGRNAKRFAPSKELAEACLVVSVLDRRVKKTIIDDMIKTQLAEYDVLYAGTEVDGGLNKVELRRKWFLKTAIEFEKTLAAMFPPSWQVPAHLAFSFCEMTSVHLKQAMQLRQDNIDVATLLNAHKVLSELESLLAKKYVTFTSSVQWEGTSKGFYINPFESVDEPNTNPFHNDDAFETTAKRDAGTSPFVGAICECFHPFLHVYLRNVDKRLNEQIEKFAIEMKNYKFEHIDTEASNVVPFCGELFTIYKNVLVEFLHLSSGEDLPGLAEVMQKHLKEFGIKVLRAALPRLGANMPNMPKDLNMKELTAVLAQVQTLWREGDTARLSEDDIRKVCSVLVSSEYCEEMTSRLDAKLKEKSSSGTSALRANIAAHCSSLSFSAEEDQFHAILTECIALLVAHVESQCDVALMSMCKINWHLDQTGDQSAYVTSVSHTVTCSIPLIRHNLHSSRKYFTRFCDKLAANIISKFIQQIYRCRPLNSVGCEQLLLDSHALKAIVFNLPVVGSRVNRDPPQAYTRMVSRAMSRAELLLQVVMSECSSNLELVDKFTRLLPEASINDFQKVLELRGVKDRAPVLEMYRRKVNENPGDQSTMASLSATTSDAAATNVLLSPERETSKIARLERMLKSRRLMIP